LNYTSGIDCNFPVINFTEVKNKVLNWANRFNTFCFLDNHQYQSEQHNVECILAAGKKDFIECNVGNALEQLKKFMQRSDRDGQTRWLFGHLGYDLKNEIEAVHSDHIDGVQFPDLYFFEPQVVIRFSEKEMIIKAENGDAEEIFRSIMSAGEMIVSSNPVTIQNRIQKEEYISIINELRRHILRGDCYEINFCQEFFAEHAVIEPVSVYKKLAAISPNPFSALYRLNDKWLICASPERFLKKTGRKILSQPIKGTSKRMKDKKDDAAAHEQLFHSSKDRSENVMVVDLVRNDLAKICVEGTVNVDELYGIYSFPQVHQMISTVSGELKENIFFADIIRATFPMGSMTGAPKKKVLELIEEYEKTKRGVFSGAVGYIDPNGDFDFNVVIRSILYNAETGYLSFPAGSGITFYSEAEKEWEECLLKAEAIKMVLEK
jgi:para-aminobenzoate synthetase component 1